MRPKDKCPGCGGLKDYRAKTCAPCRPITTHSRYGRGKLGPGRYMNPSGYVTVKVGDEVLYEHRVVMERLLGRSLLSNEHVHHIDHDRSSNSVDNLAVMTAAEHGREHFDSERATALSKLGHLARWGH